MKQNYDQLLQAFSHRPETPELSSQCLPIQQPEASSHLFQGDNLQLCLHLKESPWKKWIQNAGGLKVIYIDPPYNVGSNFSTKSGEFAYSDKWPSPGAYLEFMAQRLPLMIDLLAEDGSLYLHCDYRMTAALRLMLDGMMGAKSFRNEIIWHFSNGGGRSRRTFNRKHNTIFLYSKSERAIFNAKAAGVPRNQNESTFSGYFKTDSDGRRYQEVRSNGKVYTYYLDEHKNADDVWNIPIISQRDRSERVDYPTQKPLKLLRRILLASSNKGDLVADFFCGSGTTLIAAEELGRRWIGCDMGTVAINKVQQRLKATDAKPFEMWTID